MNDPQQNNKKPDDDVAIRIRGISKKYELYRRPQDRLKEALHPFRRKYHKDFWALDNISLDIHKGEIFGIVGRNGSGKSTILKIISGILQPTTGTVEVKGKVAALLEVGSGMNPNLTGIENIQFMGALQGLSKKGIEEITAEVIEFADLGDYIYQPLRTYSSGMRSRLGFAVSTSITPEILILDEVLAVGDTLFKRKAFARMEKLLEGDTTVLFVSHSEQSVIQLCSRAMMLDAGKKMVIGNTKEVIEYYQKYHFKPKINKVAIEEKDSDKSDDAEAKKNISNKQLIDDNYFPLFASAEYSNSGNKLTTELIPKNISQQNKAQVDIVSYKLLDRDGEEVNRLLTYDTYYLIIKYVFHETISNAYFDFVIFNEKGLIISRNITQNTQWHISNVTANSEFVVKWKFKCNLLFGNYFIGIATSSNKSEKPLWNALIKDAIPVEVIRPDFPTENGFSALEPEFSITETSSEDR